MAKFDFGNAFNNESPGRPCAHCQPHLRRLDGQWHTIWSQGSRICAGLRRFLPMSVPCSEAYHPARPQCGFPPDNQSGRAWSTISRWQASHQQGQMLTTGSPPAPVAHGRFGKLGKITRTAYLSPFSRLTWAALEITKRQAPASSDGVL